MARKAVSDKKRARNSGISLPEDLIRKATKLANAQGMSLSGFARKLIIMEMEKEAQAA